MLSRRAVVVGLTRLSAAGAGLVLVNGCGLIPFAAQSRVARVGYLSSGTQVAATQFDAFRGALRDVGWVEGQNLTIDHRTFEDHPERIPDLAAELVALKPDVLVTGSAETALAFQRASASIPVVFCAAIVTDGNGVIASYARPGTNVTGTTRTAGVSLGPKLIDLLRQLQPSLARVAVVFEAANTHGANDFRETHDATQSIGIDAQAVDITSPEDVKPALNAALAGHPQALTVGGRVILPSAMPEVVGFANQHGLLSASYETTTLLDAGGLLYYGPDSLALYRRAANYQVDHILRGAKPSDLPVEGPSVFDLIVNRTTARMLGIAIPPEFAAQVTEWVS
jgi:putative ABC transport system substrate-binding protein